MKALEITIFLIILLACIPLTIVLLPAMPGGIPTGSAGNLSELSSMTLNTLSSHKPLDQNAGIIAQIIDQASYFFNLAVTALRWIGVIFFAIIWVYPYLVGIFGINPIFSALLQIGIWLVYVIGWMQIIKGDDWSGKR